MGALSSMRCCEGISGVLSSPTLTQAGTRQTEGLSAGTGSHLSCPCSQADRPIIGTSIANPFRGGLMRGQRQNKQDTVHEQLACFGSCLPRHAFSQKLIAGRESLWDQALT